MIVPRYYENLQVLHENTMPDRAYYISASHRLDDPARRRTVSDRMQLLSGDWSFRYYDSVTALQEPFYRPDYPLTEYRTVPVPAVWQSYGVDRYHYVVIDYPFPVDPPYVAQKNPCGCYVREFDYRCDEAAPRAFLNFEGVDSCFYVWLNGEYGIYVMDEADNESNSAQFIYFEDDSWDNSARRWNELISNNPDFIEATLDRTRRCVCRDKNRPCVLLWSMGNESGYGCTFQKALEWTKSFDPTRLTHYESVYYDKEKQHFDLSVLDVHSRMYPPLSDILHYMENDPDKPFVMCEYSHAMGNGPGDLEDYRELIEKYDAFCGGFVWEWCQHGVYMGMTEDGRKKYYYGGDFGEDWHSDHVCVDGLVYPDRTPGPGLPEYKNVNRPVRVTAFDAAAGVLTLHNYLDFTDLKNAVELRWAVECDGETAACGKAEELDAKEHNFELEPCGSTVLCVDHRHNGIGSNSTGPELLPRYRLPDENMTLSLTLLPL